MIRVLIDGRVSGHDGIGRYTTCLTRALRMAAGPDIHVTVLPPTGTSRYSQAESAELARAAVDARADIIHVLDFRIAVDPLPVPIIATVHDVLRLDLRYCHTNEQFAHRYGDNWLAGLQFAVRDLRERPGASRTQLEGISLYAEYYARMLAWTCLQASYVVTPTETVARQLAQAVRLGGRPVPIPLGIDHWAEGATGDPDILDTFPGQYLLYVGQARMHKGLPELIEAYQYSQASSRNVPLVCAGRDFAPGTDAAAQLEGALGGNAIAIGEVPDETLRHLYAHATALVHLAVHEGFGLTPLEAMTCGSRVIASGIPVLRETLGQHAEFVESDNALDAAGAIDKILAEPDDEQARDARMRWASRYTRRRHADSILRLYRGCQPG